MTNKELAQKIVQLIGGSENIESITHCATRLRITVKNDSKVNTADIQNLKGVLKVVEAGGQFQIVIGSNVSSIYKEIVDNNEINKDPSNNKNQKILDRVFNLFSGVFTPIVPVLAGSGILRGLLTLFSSIGVLSPESGTYIVLFAAADTILYFLPLFLAVTSARYFKVNEFIGLAVGGSLLYPTMLDAFNNGAAMNFLGLEVTLIKYASSVVPIIISVYVLSLLDRTLRKIIPNVVESFFVPLLDLAILIPITFLAIGPVFTFLTETFTNGFLAVYSFNPIIFGLLFGLCWHPLVVFGLHRGFIPINLNNLATQGKDPLLAITMPSNFAQTGASLGVAFRTKNKDFRGIAASNVIAGLFGITEPIIYGVTLRTKQPFYYSCLMAGISGAIVSGAGVYAIGLPAGGILATPVFAQHGIVWYLFACVLAMVGSFLLTVIFGFKDVDAEPEDLVKKMSERIAQPVAGKVIDLSEVSDSTFSSKALGNGFAILPEENEIKSPITGTVSAVFPTNHAIGITSDSGTEILIHIGIDTVKLEGEGFKVHVSEGQHVTQGEKIAFVDFDAIKSSGYDTTTMVIVTNSEKFDSDKLQENFESMLKESK